MKKDSYCTGCPLIDSPFVPPEGRPDSPICIIGEAPGKVEEEEQRPFVGPAGNLPNSFLHFAKIKREDAYITNVVKCKPPKNDLVKNPIGKEALRHCLKKFIIEMQGVHSHVKVPTGNTALRALGIRYPIGKARGSVTMTSWGKVLPTWHPAYILRQWKDKIHALHDWEKVKRHSEIVGYTKQLEKFLIIPTIKIVEEWCGDIVARADKGLIDVALDIETFIVDDKLKTPYKLIGMATDTENAISTPFIKQSGNYYWKNKDEELRAIRAIGLVLEHPKVRKILHNALFDLKILMNHGFEVVGPVFDTMIAHSLIYFPAAHSLEFVVSIYADYETWKLTKGDTDIGERTYNCRDNVVMMMVLPGLETDLRDNGMEYLATNMIMPNILPTCQMMLNGLYVSPERLKECKLDITREQLALHGELKALSSMIDINPGSTTQVAKILFDIMKLKSAVKTPKGKLSTSEEVLNRLSKRYPDNRFVTALIEWRKMDKLRSTYASPPIHKDTGRVHSEFKMHTVVTLRYASVNPNVMNLPTGRKTKNKDYIRRIYTTPPSRIIIAVDQEQAELRIFAEIIQDQIWLACFANKEDIHISNGTALMGDLYDDVKYRTFGKNFTYGLIYGSEGAEIEKVAPRELIEHIKVPEMLKLFQQTHPKMFDYRDKILEDIEKRHKIVNPFGATKWYPTKATKADIRAGYNYKIQSTTAVIMHELMAKSHNELDPDRDKIILQLHDGLYIETDLDRKDAVAATLKEIFEAPVHSPMGYTFQIPVEIKTGISLSQVELEKWSGT